MRTCAECKRGIHMFCESRRARLKRNLDACGCLDRIHLSNNPDIWRRGVGELNNMSQELLTARFRITKLVEVLSKLVQYAEISNGHVHTREYCGMDCAVMDAKEMLESIDAIPETERDK